MLKYFFFFFLLISFAARPDNSSVSGTGRRVQQNYKSIKHPEQHQKILQKKSFSEDMDRFIHTWLAITGIGIVLLACGVIFSLKGLIIAGCILAAPLVLTIVIAFISDALYNL